MEKKAASAVDSKEIFLSEQLFAACHSIKMHTIQYTALMPWKSFQISPSTVSIQQIVFPILSSDDVETIFPSPQIKQRNFSG